MELGDKSRVYTVSLFDGDSDGLIEIAVDEDDLVCYKLTKSFFPEYKDDKEIKDKKSVYLLYGDGMFYVGQAGIRKDGTAITSRIQEHLNNPSKSFLEEIIFFCQDKNQWDAGTLDYLEASLIARFKEKGFKFAQPQKDEPIDNNQSKQKLRRYARYLDEIDRVLTLLGFDKIRRLSAMKEDKDYPSEVSSEVIPKKEEVQGVGFFPKGEKRPDFKDDVNLSPGSLLYNGLNMLASSGFEFYDSYFNNNLRNSSWCKDTFGVSHFLLYDDGSVSDDDFYIYPSDKKRNKKRFNVNILHFGKHSFYVTSQLYDYNRKRVLEWLRMIVSEADTK